MLDTEVKPLSVCLCIYEVSASNCWIFFNGIHHYLSDQLTESEMGGACSMHWRQTYNTYIYIYIYIGRETLRKDISCNPKV